jgi:hypothetical protein
MNSVKYSPVIFLFIWLLCGSMVFGDNCVSMNEVVANIEKQDQRISLMEKNCENRKKLDTQLLAIETENLDLKHQIKAGIPRSDI